MSVKGKINMFARAREHVVRIRDRITRKTSLLGKKIDDGSASLIKGGLLADEKLALGMLVKEYKRSCEHLEQLYPSPYFVRCDVLFDGEHEVKQLYFAKFPFSEEGIYSWIVPAAKIRFEEVGQFSYETHDGTTRSGKLLRRDQFMIVDGKIMFMAHESQDSERTLIHQEHLTRTKTDFVLPEIVEVMEKAQDAVIRANYRGSFLISGPAGSGKTTLALHRVAYLTQSPDTASLFPSDSIIVFVQDTSTKKYFSGLLPELGIVGVIITTFDEWALEMLGLNNVSYVYRYGRSESERDLYEFTKYQALQSLISVHYSSRIFSVLERVYKAHFTLEQMKLFSTQRKERVLDRFDLTILLHLFTSDKGVLTREQVSYRTLRGGKARKQTTRVPLYYSLLIVDEAENYLAEQIRLFRSLVHPKTEAILYVGDLAQRSQLCTIADWSDVGETFASGRSVVLEKVYRSTKEILEYIRSRGFMIDIPEGIRSGKQVQEVRARSADEQISYVKYLITQSPQSTIGILSKHSGNLSQLRDVFVDYEKVHVLTIHEAQGVEFDIVCLIDDCDGFFMGPKESHSYPNALCVDREQLDNDLLYIALTRAMNELHVFSK